MDFSVVTGSDDWRKYYGVLICDSVEGMGIAVMIFFDRGVARGF